MQLLSCIFLRRRNFRSYVVLKRYCLFSVISFVFLIKNFSLRSRETNVNNFCFRSCFTYWYISANDVTMTSSSEWPANQRHSSSKLTVGGESRPLGFLVADWREGREVMRRSVSRVFGGPQLSDWLGLPISLNHVDQAECSTLMAVFIDL